MTHTHMLVAGLSMQKAILREQLGRVKRGDSFASMLLMGKIKTLQREIEAVVGPYPFKDIKP